MIRLGQGGNYAPQEPPVLGMRQARKLGMITYRSAGEWAQRFGRERTTDGDPHSRFGIDFEVESYLQAHANKFIGTFATRTATSTCRGPWICSTSQTTAALWPRASSTYGFGGRW